MNSLATAMRDGMSQNKSTPKRNSDKLCTSAGAVIDALGGTNAFARLLGVGASSVSNYRRQGFPHRTHARLAMLCEQRNIRTNANVLGGMRTSTPAHFHYVSKITAQAKTNPLHTTLAEAGFEPAEVPILQPSTPFIAQLGEEMRRRLYRFTTPNGEELCLRPELTIPIALSLDHAKKNARYCYEGVAFRYQPRGAMKPEEFTQIGIEIFNDDGNPSDNEIEILRHIVNALGKAQVQAYQLHLNDTSLFGYILDALGIPAPWRRQLVRAQGTPQLERILARLQKPQTVPPTHIVEPTSIFDADENPHLVDWLRTRLTSAELPPLDAQIAMRIKNAAELECNAAMLPEAIGKILPKISAKLTRQLMIYKARLDMIHTIMPHNTRFIFSATLGRKLAYYTGFAFEIRTPMLKDRAVLATGGRYDNLLATIRPDLNAKGGAVGGVLNAERVAEAVQL